MTAYLPEDWPYSLCNRPQEDDPFSPDFDGSLQERSLELEIERGDA